MVVQLTTRDVAVLDDPTRFYGLTAAQIAARHFGALRTAANRLADLAGAAYVTLRRPWYRGPGVYVATALGARSCGSPLPPPRYSRLSIGHHLTVADLARVLVATYAAQGATWIPERELRSRALTAIRERHSGRLAGGSPHVPDGLLVLPSASGGPAERVAVEVEIAGKTRREYRRVLGRLLPSPDYARVAWFCATDAVAERIADVIERERLDDCMTVQPLPAGVTVPSWD